LSFIILAIALSVLLFTASDDPVGVGLICGSNPSTRRKLRALT